MTNVIFESYLHNIHLESNLIFHPVIQQLLDSVFVISETIKVSVSVISLSLRPRLITLTSTLIIPDITKTSSNNCLLIFAIHLTKKERKPCIRL